MRRCCPTAADSHAVAEDTRSHQPLGDSQPQTGAGATWLPAVETAQEQWPWQGGRRGTAAWCRAVAALLR